jgi:hypothetical protein
MRPSRHWFSTKLDFCLSNRSDAWNVAWYITKAWQQAPPNKATWRQLAKATNAYQNMLFTYQSVVWTEMTCRHPNWMNYFADLHFIPPIGRLHISTKRWDVLPHSRWRILCLERAVSHHTRSRMKVPLGKRLITLLICECTHTAVVLMN